MKTLNDLSDLELLTTCLWAEARGEPIEGQIAVCNVILNRARKKMGTSLHDVILKPAQFSWTDPHDVNYQKTLTAEETSHESWARARGIAETALKGMLLDNTKNADHYLNVILTKKFRGGTLPKWAQDGIDRGRVTVVIGNHTFLNLRG